MKNIFSKVAKYFSKCRVLARNFVICKRVQNFLEICFRFWIFYSKFFHGNIYRIDISMPRVNIQNFSFFRQPSPLIAACSHSAGIKSRQPRQLRPFFREVLRENCTRKKIPEMTIRLPGCREANLVFGQSGQNVPFFREVLRKNCTRKKIPEIAMVLSTLSNFLN